MTEVILMGIVGIVFMIEFNMFLYCKKQVAKYDKEIKGKEVL